MFFEISLLYSPYQNDKESFFMDIQVNDVSKIYGTGENEVVALCHANMIVHSGDFIRYEKS